MTFRVEFSADAEHDFELIFDRIFESYRVFGESIPEALAHAEKRITAIRRAAERLGTAPHRGSLQEELLPGLHHLTLDRAIYWFEIDDASRMVRVLAIFFGGQDHVRQMLIRLIS